MKPIFVTFTDDKDNTPIMININYIRSIYINSSGKVIIELFSARQYEDAYYRVKEDYDYVIKEIREATNNAYYM